MKKYEPEALVAISRYQNWFPTLPKDIRQDVYDRMRELLKKYPKVHVTAIDYSELSVEKAKAFNQAAIARK